MQPAVNFHYCRSNIPVRRPSVGQLSSATLFSRAFVLSRAIVLVTASPPDTLTLVAPLGSAVEPLIHAPHRIQSARKGRIGVINDAVVQSERAHARPLANVRGDVGSSCGCV